MGAADTGHAWRRIRAEHHPLPAGALPAPLSWHSRRFSWCSSERRSTFTAVRIYESTVRILIERENPKVVSFQEVLDPGEITDDYYETQYRILQSRVLARRTIDALNLWSDPQFNQPPG